MKTYKVLQFLASSETDRLENTINACALLGGVVCKMNTRRLRGSSDDYTIVIMEMEEHTETCEEAFTRLYGVDAWLRSDTTWMNFEAGWNAHK